MVRGLFYPKSSQPKNIGDIMKKYTLNGNAFIMPSDFFDPFREKCDECSICHNFIHTNTDSICDLISKCPYCGVEFKYEIHSTTAMNIYLNMGTIKKE